MNECSWSARILFSPTTPSKTLKRNPQKNDTGLQAIQFNQMTNNCLYTQYLKCWNINTSIIIVIIHVIQILKSLTTCQEELKGLADFRLDTVQKIWSQLQTMLYSFQRASSKLRVLNNPPFRPIPCHVTLLSRRNSITLFKQYVKLHEDNMGYFSFLSTSCAVHGLLEQRAFHHSSPLTQHSESLARDMSPFDLNY